MTKRRPPITLQEHIEFGRKLCAAEKAVHVIMARIPNSTSRACKIAMRCAQNLELLRCILDDDVCALVPRERDPRNLAICVYYGDGLTVCDDEQSVINDAFAGWRDPRN